jgi:AcrR family transcriptional regulator
MDAMDQGYATTKTRPLRRDAERNRLLILRAARVVFAQRGLEATLDEVAREAGLGVGTVYRRFPNREALIDALFDDGINEIMRIVDEAEAEPRAWDGLRHFMTSVLQLQAADRGLRDVMLSQRSPDPDHDVLRDHLKPPLDRLVHRAQQEGDLRKDLTSTDVGVLEVAVLGAAEFTAVAAPGAWQRFLAIVLDGMRATRGRDRQGNPIEHPPLPAPPLDDDQIDACMVGWKYGGRETPRHRAKAGGCRDVPTAASAARAGGGAGGAGAQAGAAAAAQAGDAAGLAAAEASTGAPTPAPTPEHKSR